jgi:hypothetical protein
MCVNKKLLNSAKYSIGKINCDVDEIIYLTEIISTYFDNYKNNINDSKEDDEEEDNDEDNDSIKSNNEEVKKEIINIKKPLKNNDSELINFMNEYHINIDGLENLLKVEKLNLTSEKRKKKFTLKLKKDISNYLVNQT